MNMLIRKVLNLQLKEFRFSEPFPQCFWSTSCNIHLAACEYFTIIFLCHRFILLNFLKVFDKKKCCDLSSLVNISL